MLGRKAWDLDHDKVSKGSHSWTLEGKTLALEFLTAPSSLIKGKRPWKL